LNIFSHFSRDEIGKLVEELCRTGLHFVAASKKEIKKQKGWREVIFYSRSDDFQAFFKDNEVKLASPLITRLLQAIDDMRSVAGCTASTWDSGPIRIYCQGAGNAHSDGKSVRFRQIECCMFNDSDGHLLDIFDSHKGTSKGAHLGTIHFPTGTSALIMDKILAGAVYTNSGRDEPVTGGDSKPVHQFTDKRTGKAKQLPLSTSYVTDFDTYDAQEMQNFHAQHVHADHAGTVAAPSALVAIAFDLTLASPGRRKWDGAAAVRGGSISKSPAACDNMPPGFTQSVKRTGSFTATSGKKFTGVKAAWDRHDPSGEARMVFDEAKEAAKKESGQGSVQESGQGSGQAGQGSGQGSSQAGQGSGQGSGQAGQGSGQGSGQAGQESGQGSGQAGQEGSGLESGHVKYEHREWRRDTLR
jgi:hypothetical protein